MMEQLHNGYTLELSSGGFPLSTDSVALSGFAKLPKNAAVLDLGSGCGTLGLLLCARYADCTVTGIELSSEDHDCALENARRNGLTNRLKSVCADLRSIPDFLQPGAFHTCISNPPYYTGGPKSSTAAGARHTDTCTSQDLFRAAAWALRYGGDFFLVHKPERLSELCYYATCNHLEPKTLCLLRHRQDGPVSLILLQCRKGAKPGLTLQEHALHTPDGTPTAYYQALYHCKEET